MAGVPVDKTSAVKAAGNLGRNGRPIPDAIANDPTLRAAYYDGARKPDPDAAPPSDDHDGGAAHSRVRKAGTAAGRKAKGAAKSGAKATFTRKNATGLVAHPARTLGTPGGLLLAIFIYPLLQAVLDGGPAGARTWLAAKFLNHGTGTLASSKYKRNPYVRQPGAPNKAVGRKRAI